MDDVSSRVHDLQSLSRKTFLFFFFKSTRRQDALSQLLKNKESIDNLILWFGSFIFPIYQRINMGCIQCGRG